MKYLIALVSLFISRSVYSQHIPDIDKDCPKGQLDKQGHWKCDPLPITLRSFTAKLSMDYIILSWKVENVVDHSHYEVYRSYDGNKYEMIGTTTLLYYNDTSIEKSAFYYLVDVSTYGVKTKHKVIYVEYIQKVYNVFDLETGKYIGSFTEFKDLPRNKVLSVNRRKIIIK